MQITRNFKDSEFQCPCCGVIKYDKSLVDKLQIIRNIIGVAITINSGYRCSNHNTKVGGYIKSLHMQGIAVDMKVTPGKMKDLIELSKHVFYNNGVGVYPNHIHVDMGTYQRFTGKY